MKRTILLATILVLAGAGTAQSATQKFDVAGIPVILKSNAEIPVVSATFLLDGGLPYYGIDQAGLEPVLLMSAKKGTRKYPKEQMQAILARTGARLDNASLPDMSYLSLTCLRRDLDETWDVFASVITLPELDPDEVALVRERQINNVRQQKDDPDAYLSRLADELHFAGHPYAVSSEGTEEVLEKCTVQQLRKYHAEHVNKTRALVVIVGDVDRETAERLVTDGFGNLPKGSYSENALTRPARSTDPDTRLTERELPTNYIMGRYEVPSLDDPDYAAIRVAHYILRDRVFEEVRTKRNLSYAPAAGISFRRDNYGYLYVTAVEPDTTVRVMLAEVRKMQDGEVSQKELTDQIKVQITRYLMSQQTTGSQAEELGRWELLGGGWEGADNLVDRVRQVTVDDITRVCQKYIQNIDFVMLGDPQKWEDPLAADQPAVETESLN